MASDNLTFISNNVTGIQQSSKRIKVFEYLKNLYNANIEKEQLDTLTKLSEMLNSIPNIVNKNVIPGGDFNLFFYTSLETQGRNPILNKKSLLKLIEITFCSIYHVSPRFPLKGNLGLT